MGEIQAIALKAIGFSDQEIAALAKQARAAMQITAGVASKERHQASADALAIVFEQIEAPGWQLYEDGHDQDALTLALAQKAFVERYGAALKQARHAARFKQTTRDFDQLMSGVSQHLQKTGGR